VNEVRMAWRQLLRTPGLVLIAVGVLVVGMASAVSAFSVVTHVLWPPLPVRDPDRVVAIAAIDTTANRAQHLTPAEFVELRRRVRLLEHVAAAEPFSRDLSTGERPRVVRVGQVTRGFFDSFDLAPVHGRVFGPDDFRPGSEKVAVLTWELWRRQFQGDPRAIGATVYLDDEPRRVVGVLPERFERLVLPDMAPRELFTPRVDDPAEARVQVMARLPDGANLEAVNAELSALATQIGRAGGPVRLKALSLRDHMTGQRRPAVVAFGVAMILVLLLAVANVANLLLVRNLGRRHEFEIQLALGASVSRLMRQVLVESLLLSSVAAAASIAAAGAFIWLLARISPQNLQFLSETRLDAKTMAFAIALIPVVAMLAAVIPAVRVAFGARLILAARTSTHDRIRGRWQIALVVSQLALALALVTGAGLLLRSFSALVAEDLGFDRERVALVQVMAWGRQPGPAALQRFFEEAETRLRQLPGVSAVGAVSAMPFIETNVDIQSPISIVGEVPSAGRPQMVSVTVVTPGYFDAIGARLVSGRLLNARDTGGRAPAAVVSEELARRYFRRGDPVGSTIQVTLQARPRRVQIVGVVASLKHERFDVPPRPEVFLPMGQAPFGFMVFVMRTRSEPAAVLEPAREAIWSIAPQQAVYDSGTLRQLVGRTVAPQRFALMLGSAFGAIAMLLAAAGLYAVLAAVVVQRRREIGVRIALGAQPWRITRMVVARGMWMGCAGALLGLAGAAAAAKMLRRFLYGVEPIDAAAFLGAAALMIGVAAVASYFPARRAAATDAARTLVE
jgi:putative ABC transport system permease protein